MAVSMITGFDLVLDADLTDAAVSLWDDANTHTRRATMTQVRTRIMKPTDATVDIGVAATNRFRDLFLSRNASIGGTLGVTGVSTLGVVNAGVVTVTSVSGDGSLLTSLNATQLITGTVPTARVSGSYLNITNLGAISHAGNVIATTDATYDLGASGANRFRDLFLSRNALIGGTLGVTGVSTFGTVNAGVVTVTSVAGDGSSLTSLNATQLITGTVPTARVSGSYLNITNLGAISHAGNVIATTDATYDLGASGANRFRDLFLSRNIVAGGSVTAGSFVGPLTGNASTATLAATATALASARTIGGVSFNGTANITVASATGGFAVSGGSLLAANDATDDIGASGATRFRDLFLSRNASIGGVLSFSASSTPAAGLIGYNSGAGLYIRAQIGSVRNFTLYDSGGSVIFTNTTGVTLAFPQLGAGALSVDGSGNITSSSDERLKNIVSPFTTGLEGVRKLSPVLYGWNAESGLEQDGVYAGFSAQNAREASKYTVGKDPKGYLSLQDRAILALVVNAVKELDNRLVALDRRIAA